MPLSVVTKADVETLHLWSTQDALVLKILAMALPGALFVVPSWTPQGHRCASALDADIPTGSYFCEKERIHNE
jgi:hypothetical protein